MERINRVRIVVAALPFVTLCLLMGPSGILRGQSSGTGDASDSPVAVEPDVGELMELVFQPTYNRLKASLKSEPQSRRAWRPLRSDVLILAEANNHLLHRKPENDVADWLKHATAARAAGAKMYDAAKRSAFEEVKVSFASMLTQCNACHTQFADGEHQLKP